MGGMGGMMGGMGGGGGPSVTGAGGAEVREMTWRVRISLLHHEEVTGGMGGAEVPDDEKRDILEKVRDACRVCVRARTDHP